MIKTLGTPEFRRYPALLLVSCLLMLGVQVTRAPVRDGETDGMSAHVPAHVLRAPGARVATQPGPPPIVVPIAGFSLPLEWVVREAGEHGRPVVVLRSTPRPFHLSRAPPASS
jgi:hypothetical protein